MGILWLKELNIYFLLISLNFKTKAILKHYSIKHSIFHRIHFTVENLASKLRHCTDKYVLFQDSTKNYRIPQK